VKKSLILMIFCLITSGCGSKPGVELIPAASREKAPEIVAYYLNVPSNGLSIAELKGKVVVADFWATWCGPCRMEIPSLVKLSQQYQSKGVQILGLSIEDNDHRPIDYFHKFCSDNGVNYPIALVSMQTIKDYGAGNYIPTTFFIDKSGRIALSLVGFHPEEELTGALDALVKE
jgi:thiol-disulfide isomerase/thioredoxin